MLWLACHSLGCSHSPADPVLRLSTASAARGEQVAIEVSLESPAGKEPLGVQWETKLPSAQVGLVDDKVLIGSAAQQAGKALSCVLKQKNAADYILRCILVGGQQPIPNGTLALLRLRISPKAQTGPARIRLEQGLAVSKDLKNLPLGPVETTVRIQK